MTVEERLKTLMTKGFDINIECKGVGRKCEMTYEAYAKRSTPSSNDNNDFSWLMVQSHAVGNSLDELLDNLEQNFVKHAN